MTNNGTSLKTSEENRNSEEDHNAVLWQKEASGIPSKSELLYQCFHSLLSVLFFQAKFCA